MLLDVKASLTKSLSTSIILLSARASPAERYISYDMCGHPLGNTIEFHLLFSRFPTIRTSLGARIAWLAVLFSSFDQSSIDEFVDNA